MVVECGVGSLDVTADPDQDLPSDSVRVANLVCVTSSRFSVPKNDSVMLMSQRLPTRPTDWHIRWHRSVEVRSVLRHWPDSTGGRNTGL